MPVTASTENVDAEVELEVVDEERLRDVRLHDRVLAETDALRLPREPDAASLTRRRRLHDVRLALLRRRVRLQVAEAARARHTTYVFIFTKASNSTVKSYNILYSRLATHLQRTQVLSYK